MRRQACVVVVGLGQPAAGCCVAIVRAVNVSAVTVAIGADIGAIVVVGAVLFVLFHGV